MTVIDVHTHMFTTKWLELLKKTGGTYNIKTRPDGQDEIFRGDTPVVIPQKGHFDWELRIRAMDAAGIDVSVVSLTCPNVYWGGEDVSVRAAMRPLVDGRAIPTARSLYLADFDGDQLLDVAVAVSPCSFPNVEGGGGKRPITLANGETRTFLEDGDSLVLRAHCERAGARRIGFGLCEGQVLASRAPA